jgi:uncharacterized phage protein (TIGR02216 family)
VAHAIPWRDWLGIALSFGISPENFWRLSVKEWRALASAGAPPLGRHDLEALMQLYPDVRP